MKKCGYSNMFIGMRIIVVKLMVYKRNKTTV